MDEDRAPGEAGLPPAVHVVFHSRPVDDEHEDIKLIGVYSSPERATAAVARLCAHPGFCDWPDRFHIDRCPLDRDHWTEGFVTIPHGVPDAPDA